MAKKAAKKGGEVGEKNVPEGKKQNVKQQNLKQTKAH